MHILIHKPYSRHPTNPSPLNHITPSSHQQHLLPTSTPFPLYLQHENVLMAKFARINTAYNRPRTSSVHQNSKGLGQVTVRRAELTYEDGLRSDD
jgi:hypothetical protein